MQSTPIPTLSYSSFERLHVGWPVDRLRYIKEKCRGKRILDLGAYDETEIEKAQHQSWKWLHAEIAEVATAVLGVDASSKLPAEGITSHVGTRIVRGTVEDLGGLIKEFFPDLVIAGELIEHTPDTLGWLSRLAADAPGVEFLATTPNATSMVNILLAFLGRENNHPDHLHIYSYKTLATLASKIPLKNQALTPYYYNPTILLGMYPGFLAPIISLMNFVFARPLMILFPMIASGWILEGTL